MELKVWVSENKVPLRLVTSNFSEWDGDGFRECLNELTGFGEEWSNIETNERKCCSRF
jgi:hypothetical protein